MTSVIALVGTLGGVLGAVKEVVEKNSTFLGELKGALEKVIEVVLEVVTKLEEGVEKKDGSVNGKEAKDALEGAQAALQAAKGDIGNGYGKLGEAKEKLEDLSNNGNGKLKVMWEAIKDEKEKSLKKFIEVSNGKLQVDPGKNTVSVFIHKLMGHCAGGTEVIKALIDQLALGLQKWVGWEKDKEVCCLDTETGIGKKCDCRGGGTCCTGGTSSSCTCNTNGKKCCYLSAYKRPEIASSSGSSSSSSSSDLFLWTSISSDSTKVHLLARIFLGSVCLIWSGLTQLGFLTGSGSNRLSQDGKVHEVANGLGSFMAAMGYDLERLNQGKGKYSLG